MLKKLILTPFYKLVYWHTCWVIICKLCNSGSINNINVPKSCKAPTLTSVSYIILFCVFLLAYLLSLASTEYMICLCGVNSHCIA